MNTHAKEAANTWEYVFENTLYSNATTDSIKVPIRGNNSESKYL